MYLKREKTADAGAQLNELAKAARQAYSDVRESIIGLRTLPGGDNTFEQVIREYAERWEEMSGVKVRMSVADAIHLRPTHELQLVRIVQEALTNVRKHARASQATVEIRRDGQSIVATITDDGVGFKAAARARGEFPQFGLSTMRERAESIGGVLLIDSQPGAGTTVRFELPLGEAVA